MSYTYNGPGSFPTTPPAEPQPTPPAVPAVPTAPTTLDGTAELDALVQALYNDARAWLVKRGIL